MSGVEKVFLLVVPTILVACVGVGALAYFIGNKAVTRMENAITGPASPEVPDHTAGIDSFTLPASVAGLHRITGSAATQFATSGAAGMRAELGGSTPVIGIYGGDITNPKNLLVMMGVPHASAAPKSEAAGALAGLGADANYRMGSARSFNPGPLGGALQGAAGILTGDGRSHPLSVCAAADTGGIILLLYFDHSAATTAAALVHVRPKFEKR